MKIIGTIGQNGSGKDALVDYLHEKYGVPIYRAGDIARDIAAQEGIPRTRENLHDISRRFMEKHGRDFFSRNCFPASKKKRAAAVRRQASRGFARMPISSFCGIATATALSWCM